MIQEERIDEDVYRPTTSTMPNETSKTPKYRNIHAARAEKVLCACLGRGRVQAVSTIFKYIGSFVGRYPYAFIVGTLLFTVLSAAGGHRFRMTQDLHTGYTPSESPANREFAIAREFYSKQGQPYYSAIFITANDNGSLLRPEYLDRIDELWHYLQYNMSVKIDDSNDTYTFADLCGVYCEINQPFWQFKRLLSLRRGKAAANEPLQAGIRLEYPITSIYGLRLNMAPYLYDVQRNLSIDASQAPTSVTRVGIAVLWFPSSERRNDTMEKLLETWELKMDAYVRTNYPKENGAIRVLPHGNYSISNEVMRAGVLVVPYYSVGFAIMLAFIAVTVSAGAVYHGGLSFAVAAITVAAVCSPCLAAATTYGVFTWANLHTNVMMLIAPFLILAIGVDDAFLLVHAWQRVCMTHSSTTRANKLGIVLADVGPSILITSVTNSVAFSIGAIASPPEIRLFCATVAAAMALAFIYQICLFCPTMMLTAKDELPPQAVRLLFAKYTASIQTVAMLAPSLPLEPAGSTPFMQQHTDSPTHVPTLCEAPAVPSSPHKVAAQHTQPTLSLYPCKTGMRAGLLLYARFITSYAGRTLAAGLFGAYMFVAITGILLMKAQCVPEDTVPYNSPLVEMFRMRHNILWKQYHPISIIINKELDYSNDTTIALIESLVHDLETAPNSLGDNFTQLWLREYRPWRKEQSAWEFLDEHDDVWQIDQSDVNDTSHSADGHGVNLDMLDEFLSEKQHEFYNNMILYTGNGTDVHVHKFLFRVAFANVTSLRERAYMVSDWRAIIAKYEKSLNATLFDLDAPYSDIVLTVRGQTLTTLVVTMMSMGFVCLFFIPNIAALCVAVASIASIASGVCGFLYWWGADLDPVTMADLIMAIGFSVDYTAHISYHYYASGLTRGRRITRAQRMHNTLAHVMYPMLQASGSTAICMVPQIISPMPAHILFVKTVLLVVAAGLLHGLFFVPIILGMLPDQLTGASWAPDAPLASPSRATATAGSSAHYTADSLPRARASSNNDDECIQLRISTATNE